ncbi:MAG: YegS/Rv2252/BmrU family lipid kinase [Crocinitomicaceae bacterium]
MIRVQFIVNSKCKLSNKALLAIDLCRKSEYLNCFFSKTTEPKDATKIAHSAVTSGVDVVVAVGGDGTCNEVVNGMMMSDVLLAKLAIIPNGTGNDFHRMIGPFLPEMFVKNLEERNTKMIDLIHVMINKQKQYALNIAGAGFDGFVVSLLNKQRSRLKIGGKFSYALAILRSFFLFKKPILSVKADNFEYEGKGLLIASCNGSTFGHGLVIYPEAILDSGSFGVTFIGDVTLFDYVRYLKRIKRGIKIDHPQVYYFETQKMSIKTNVSNLFIECDGELFSSGNPTFQITPSVIQLIS